MNYFSGEEVRIGDRVSLGDDENGMVVIVFDKNEWLPSHPKSVWGTIPMKGVMINFPLYGLIHYEDSIEEDVKLLVRMCDSSI